MSSTTYKAIAVAADDRILAALELSSPLWPSPLRYALDTQAWNVVHEGGGGSVLYPALPFDAEAAGQDESGQDARSFRVPDPDRTLWRYCEAGIGEVDGDGLPIPTLATLRTYALSDLSAPLSVARLELHRPQLIDGLAVEFSAQSPDFADRDAAGERFTTVNSPGLRR